MILIFFHRNIWSNSQVSHLNILALTSIDPTHALFLYRKRDEGKKHTHTRTRTVELKERQSTNLLSSRE